MRSDHSETVVEVVGVRNNRRFNFNSLPHGDLKRLEAGSPLDPHNSFFPQTFPTMTSPSTPTQESTTLPPLPRDSPPQVKRVHTSSSYQYDYLEKARDAVLDDLGPTMPMVSFEEFLLYLAPPQPSFDLDFAMDFLKSRSDGSEPVLTPQNQWTKFLEVPKASKEKEAIVFDPLPEIFTKVAAAIMNYSGRGFAEQGPTIDFLQNPSQAPKSTERYNESRPDGYFVLKDRIKVMSEKDRSREHIQWADIALSCEYKQKDREDDLYDVRTYSSGYHVLG